MSAVVHIRCDGCGRMSAQQAGTIQDAREAAYRRGGFAAAGKRADLCPRCAAKPGDVGFTCAFCGAVTVEEAWITHAHWCTEASRIQAGKTNPGDVGHRRAPARRSTGRKRR